MNLFIRNASIFNADYISQTQGPVAIQYNRMWMLGLMKIITDDNKDFFYSLLVSYLSVSRDS